MELGVALDPRHCDTWTQALDLAERHGIVHLEPGAGGHVPKDFFDPVELSRDDAALARFAESVNERGMRIAALGVYGNPVHPDADRARAAQEDFTAMCDVAGKLGVPRVAVISGLPAGGPHDRAPNFILPMLYADLAHAYEWQWRERLIPWWQRACGIASAAGVRVCMEPIPGFSSVYDPSTFLRLREACGETLMVSVDPSHLWAQRLDPLVAVERLAGTIGYVQIKDVHVDDRRLARDGMFPPVSYDDWGNRPWVYRAIGFGHPEAWWADFFTALRRAGYDDVIGIEIEEAWMSIDEALEKSVALVRRVLPRDPVPERNWFSGYQWQPSTVE